MLLATPGPPETKILALPKVVLPSRRRSVSVFFEIKSVSKTAMQENNSTERDTPIIGRKHAGRDLGAKWSSRQGAVLVLENTADGKKGGSEVRLLNRCGTKMYHFGRRLEAKSCSRPDGFGVLEEKHEHPNNYQKDEKEENRQLIPI